MPTTASTAKIWTTEADQLPVRQPTSISTKHDNTARCLARRAVICVVIQRRQGTNQGRHQIQKWANIKEVQVHVFKYTVFRKKHPLTFSFISP